jgi:hypothetical protein
MPLLDIQRKGQQIGRIRMGEKVDTGKTYKDGSAIYRPGRLATWRFTTGSKLAAVAIADLLGGQVKQWEKNQLEVITDRSELAVVVPPRDQVISQWYEMWSKGGCARRCDSVTEKLSNKPCLCPQPEDPTDPDDVERTAIRRAELAADGKACSAITRLNVMIPDLPGLGVWRLDTKSHYAAAELGDSADLLEMARDHGVFLPAILRIDHRERVANGKTKKFPVPVLEVTATFRQIASGELTSGGVVAQLPPAPVPVRQAIAAGPAVKAQAAKAAAAVEAGPPPPDAPQIAERAKTATSRAQINAYAAMAKELMVAEDHVEVADGVYDELKVLLNARWAELPADEQAAS